MYSELIDRAFDEVECLLMQLRVETRIVDIRRKVEKRAFTMQRMEVTK